MPRSRFQITTRDLLGAIFWIAVACLAWIQKDSFKPASDEHFEIVCLILISIVVPIFIALGALFHRTLLGALVGVILTLGFCAWIRLALRTWAGT